MRCNLVSQLYGGLQIELVAESDIEAVLLEHAWRLMDQGEKPTRGNGNTITERGSTGFYLPVSRTSEEPPPRAGDAG